uniref:3-beta hydroxysteroid dehydrogenase/isomerase domain-containing protein n=1 Tax=Vitis vinifera TaxID=29760 RepID=A5AUJ1_VITVI|nr:hypothetical protein VITISV_028795 [Vitis vinifera]
MIGINHKCEVKKYDDPTKTEHLLALDGAKERLHLFKANLLEEGAFDSMVDGCEGVFHTASPFYHTVSNPQVELIDPAVKGTLNVLRSCAKVPSIRRVVVTSSMAAVAFTGQTLTPECVNVDSTSFGICFQRPWPRRLPGKFAKENKIDLVAINPGLVIGPLLQPTLNTSVEPVLKLINDVANAHIQAFEVPSANGRYCLVSRVTHCSEVVKILHELYPTSNLPDKCADDKPFEPTYQVSQERARSLGINFIPVEVSFNDTVESLKEKKFFSL